MEKNPPTNELLKDFCKLLLTCTLFFVSLPLKVLNVVCLIAHKHTFYYKEDDWRRVLGHSYLSHKLAALQGVCVTKYAGNDEEFVTHYLRPTVRLFQNIHNLCQVQYERDTSLADWRHRLDNVFQHAVNPLPLGASFQQGDFFITLSQTEPQALRVTYFNSFQKFTVRTLNSSDCMYLLLDNWPELMKLARGDHQREATCIVTGINGVEERVTWKDLMNLGDLPQPGNSHQHVDNNNNTLPSTVTCIEQVCPTLLREQAVYMPGGHALAHGRPVIFVDAHHSNLQAATVQTLATIFNYFSYLSKEANCNEGFLIVLDCRHTAKLSRTLQMLGRTIALLQECDKIQSVVLLQRDCLSLLYSPFNIQKDFNFPFELISSAEQLSRMIPYIGLPSVLGGGLTYDHCKWIEFRKQVEALQRHCGMTIGQAQSLTDSWNCTEAPKSVCEYQQTIRLSKEKFHKDVACFVEYNQQSAQLLEQLQSTSQESYCNIPTLDFNRTLKQSMDLVERSAGLYQHLCTAHAQHLHVLDNSLHTFQLRQSFHEVEGWFKEFGLAHLNERLEVACSMKKARHQMEEFENFLKQAEEHKKELEKRMEEGRQFMDMKLINEEHDKLKDQLSQLEKLHQGFLNSYNERRGQIQRALKFYEDLASVSSWWVQGLQFIARLNMEDIQSHAGIQRLKEAIDAFCKETPPRSDAELAELVATAAEFGHAEQTQGHTDQCSQTRKSLEEKRDQILAAERKITMPPRVLHWDTASMCAESEFDDRDYESMRSMQSSVCDLSSLDQTFSWNQGRVHYVEGDPALDVFDRMMPKETKERVINVINELLETEQEYVKALNYVLEHYLPEMDSAYLPATLKGKKNILFGNIDRIANFHKKYFLPEIELYRRKPLQVGKAFVRYERDFYIYAKFNRNKPRSDELWLDFANVYFENKMRQLKDKLDLASYLIKPVQRMGKYALLLSELVKCCDEKDPRLGELKAAFDVTSFQLRHGNDLLATSSLTRADINIKEQGSLLRQNEFVVYGGRRKRKRRVFLFEHALVFAKPIKQKAIGDRFLYKSAIKLVDLGLTANIGGNGLKFEVWYRRWRKAKSAGEAYVMQAESKEVKDEWTRDLTTLLWRQATRNKEYGLNEVSTGISVESTPGSLMQNDFTGNFVRRDSLTPVRNDPTRYSWMTADSSGSSGVYSGEEQASSPTGGQSMLQRNDTRYSSLPPRQRRISRGQESLSPRGGDDVQLRKDQQPNFDSAFVRNNVYRKTIQGECSTPVNQPIVARKINRRHSAHRFMTQPIVMPSNLKTGFTPSGGRLRVSSDRPTSPDILEEGSQRSAVRKSATQTDLSMPPSQIMDSLLNQRKTSVMLECTPVAVLTPTKESNRQKLQDSQTNLPDVSKLQVEETGDKVGELQSKLLWDANKISTSVSASALLSPKELTRRGSLQNFLRKRLSRSFTELL